MPSAPSQPVASPSKSFGTIEKNRRKHLFEHVDIKGRGLEIGAYEQPTVLKDEASIAYLDIQTREELSEVSRNPELVAKIPVADYLSPSNDYTEVVDETFDYVIANHVMEHVPNPIEWLRTVNSLLVDDGVLFMALPDKKFTFDRYRPDTPFSHILHDYYTGVDAISHEHLLEVEMYYDMQFIEKEMHVDERLETTRLRSCLDRVPHVGVHCHVFQSETFMDKFMKPILHMGLVEFEVVGFHDSASNYGEFMVILRKRPGKTELATSAFFTKDYEQSLGQSADVLVPPGGPLRAALRRAKSMLGR